MHAHLYTFSLKHIHTMYTSQIHTHTKCTHLKHTHTALSLSHKLTSTHIVCRNTLCLTQCFRNLYSLQPSKVLENMKYRNVRWKPLTKITWGKKRPLAQYNDLHNLFLKIFTTKMCSITTSNKPLDDDMWDTQRCCQKLLLHFFPFFPPFPFFFFWEYGPSPLRTMPPRHQAWIWKKNSMKLTFNTIFFPDKIKCKKL